MEKPRNKSNKKRSRLFSLYEAVAFLIVLAIGSFMLVASPYAKYMTQAEGEGGARVARFFVAAIDGTDDREMVLDLNNAAAYYSFTVVNFDGTSGATNETATTYDVTVTFRTAIPNVDISVTNGANTINAVVNDAATVFTMKNAGTFSAGIAERHTLTLNFSVPDFDAVDVGEWTNIEIRVTAAQVD